ncbi:MAG TPA: hypothetical protein VMH40_11055 [Myxococcaceae bacterium]|nr:hypothetical protein [Myxococcaceae bacterium]
MDSFVRRLVERLLEPSRPLSRNRHFHTFETPEGRRALGLARRLRGLARDVRRCLERGSRPEVREEGVDGALRVELRFDALGRRTAFLSGEEFEILRTLPGMAEALRRGAR